MRGELAAAAPHDDEVRVLGPAEAPLALVRGRYRFRLLVKAPRNFDLSAYLREWLAEAPKAKGNAQARGGRRSAELFVSNRVLLTKKRPRRSGAKSREETPQGGTSTID